MKTLFIFCIAIIGSLLLQSSANCQDSRSLSFVFYNVENLFDVKDDPLTNDDEFTPEGSKHWTYDRYHTKVDHIARVLTGIGEWELPALVGLCEIENIKVLHDLAGHRLIEDYGYHIIHKDSPDRRGIDVGLLYKPGIFDPIRSEWIEIEFIADSNMKTRDILYVKGLVYGKDTLHVFINHWPSRWGGVKATMPKRVEVAVKLKYITDSIFSVDYRPNIILSGDFNDTPGDSSILNVLGANTVYNGQPEGLYNLMYPVHASGKQGTLKYKGNWEVYDQVIVSGPMLHEDALFVMRREANIFSPDYLLVDDERYLGNKPFRTYSGPAYIGGFSDHLPVYVKIDRIRKDKE